MKLWVNEAALYVPFAGADAVIEHRPTPLMTPFAVHGPEAVKLTGRPAEEVVLRELSENEFPYCAFGSGGKLMVCDCVAEPSGRTMNVPDTELAALKAAEPGCEAVTVQLPVVLRVTEANETPFAIDSLPMAQEPVAVNKTCRPLGTPPDMAVAVTVGGLVMMTELGNGPRRMLWSFLSIAGGDG